MMEGAGSPHILLVDDEPVTRARVRHALRECGHEHVKEAADGLEARAYLEREPEVDLVITDILMPGMDGIELLRWGREHAPGPVWILLSGVDTFDAAVEAIRSGAFDFLAKPPGRDELDVSVRNALEQRRLRKERDRLYAELEEANRELLSKVRDLEDKSELLRRDLQRAEVIQRALLPTVPPVIEQYCIHAVHRPGRYVGGDLYDVVRLDERHVGMYVADATGHGVTAAMLSVLYKQRLMLVDKAGRPRSPATVLDSVNRSLLSSVEAPGLFLTAVYGLLDTVEGELTLASAGHPPVLHARAGGDVRHIRRTGPALGLTKDATFTEERLRLRVDDRLLMYTDGLLPSPSSDGLERLGEVLRNEATGTDELMAGASRGASKSDHAMDEDDVTILLIDVHAGSSDFDNRAASSGEPLHQPAPRPDVLYYGEDDNASFLSLRGRVIWTHCDALFETACAILQAGRPLVVDLSHCDYLDSTCLGTMHELVMKGEVSLQNVQPDVRSLFVEMSMETVLSAIGKARPLPELHPLAVGAASASSGPLRMLRAHEALAALSARNREKFEDVVRGLRQELSSA